MPHRLSKATVSPIQLRLYLFGAFQIDRARLELEGGSTSNSCRRKKRVSAIQRQALDCIEDCRTRLAETQVGFWF